MNHWGVAVVLLALSGSLALAGERLAVRNQFGEVVGFIEPDSPSGRVFVHDRDGRRVGIVDVPGVREGAAPLASDATVWTLEPGATGQRR